MLLLAVTTVSFSQIEQGTSLIGGTAGFNNRFIDRSDDFFSMNISPDYGYFVAENLALGAALGFGYSSAGDFSSTSFSLVPFGRYYFGGAGPVFFVHAELGFITSRSDSGGFFEPETFNGATFGGGPGMAFFFSDQVAIEGLLEYQRVAGDFDQSNLGLRFGVQVYLGKGGE